MEYNKIYVPKSAILNQLDRRGPTTTTQLADFLEERGLLGNRDTIGTYLRKLVDEDLIISSQVSVETRKQGNLENEHAITDEGREVIAETRRRVIDLLIL